MSAEIIIIGIVIATLFVLVLLWADRDRWI